MIHNVLIYTDVFPSGHQRERQAVWDLWEEPGRLLGTLWLSGSGAALFPRGLFQSCHRNPTGKSMLCSRRSNTLLNTTALRRLLLGFSRSRSIMLKAWSKRMYYNCNKYILIYTLQLNAMHWMSSLTPFILSETQTHVWFSHCKPELWN